MPSQKSNLRWNRPKTSRLAVCSAGCLLCLVAGLSLPGSGRAQDTQVDSQRMLQAVEQSLIRAIAETEQSVVAIARVKKGSVGDPTDPSFVPHSFGSGVIISPDGLVLTTHHVVGDPEQNDYFIWIQQRPFRAVEIRPAKEVMAADPWTDLAVLRIDASGLAPIRFGNGQQVQKGQIVIALGNPYAIARDGQPSAAWGIVSNLQREATSRSPDLATENLAETIHHHGTLIQTDARLNLGTSGGALINLDGEMIGLTTSMAALQPFDAAAGFAIPVDETFRRVVEALRQGKRPEFGFLGVGPRDLTAEQRQSGRRGVRVTEVIPGTPADISGLVFGDIITHLGGQAIDDSSQLMRELSRRAPGEKIDVTFLRSAFGSEQGMEKTVAVTLSKKHIVTPRPGYSRGDAPRWRGARVDYATAFYRFEARSQLIDPQGCVAVVEVQPDSPAWRAGLRPQTFVSHVGEVRVSTPEQFYLAAEKPLAIVLTITDDGSGKTAQIVVPAGDPRDSPAQPERR